VLPLPGKWPPLKGHITGQKRWVCWCLHDICMIPSVLEGTGSRGYGAFHLGVHLLTKRLF